MLTGNFIRGGATIGKCYIDDLGFFGPAVNRAYQIESEIAEYPVIEIDYEIGKRIYQEQITNIETPIFKWKPSIVSYKDDKYFLNYLYQLEINTGLVYENEEFYFDTVRNTVQNHIFDNLLMNVNNERIQKKMNFLDDWIKSEKCAVFHSRSKDSAHGPRLHR